MDQFHIPSLKEYLQGRLNLDQPPFFILDHAWNGYASYVNDLTQDHPNVIDKFAEHQKEWIYDISRGDGLPRDSRGPRSAIFDTWQDMSLILFG
jgi:hypothetical protein